jgi:hypothetical protein
MYQGRENTVSRFALNEMFDLAFAAGFFSIRWRPSPDGFGMSSIRMIRSCERPSLLI